MKRIRLSIVIVSGLVVVVALFFLRRETDSNKNMFFRRNNSVAVMSLLHEEDAYLNQPFEVVVEIDTLGAQVNAVGVYLNYDAKKMRLIDMDTRQSFCQFYPEKKFDNNLGTVTLACGAPHPGLEGKSTMLKLKFLPISVGSTTIHASKESQILMSDGKGTNILTEYPQSIVNIVSSF